MESWVYLGGSGASDFVIDGQVFSPNNTSGLVLNPWAKSVHISCRPEATATYSIGGPGSWQYDIWPSAWKAHLPSYIRSLGIEAIWFY